MITPTACAPRTGHRSAAPLSSWSSRRTRCSTRSSADRTASPWGRSPCASSSGSCCPRVHRCRGGCEGSHPSWAAWSACSFPKCRSRCTPRDRTRRRWRSPGSRPARRCRRRSTRRTRTTRPTRTSRCRSCGCGCGCPCRSCRTPRTPSGSRPASTRPSRHPCTRRRPTRRPSCSSRCRCGCGCGCPSRRCRRPPSSSPSRPRRTRLLRRRPMRPRCSRGHRCALARRTCRSARPSGRHPWGSRPRRCTRRHRATCRLRRPGAASHSCCTAPSAGDRRARRRTRSARCTQPSVHRCSARPQRCTQSCRDAPPSGPRSGSRRRSRDPRERHPRRRPWRRRRCRLHSCSPWDSWDRR